MKRRIPGVIRNKAAVKAAVRIDFGHTDASGAGVMGKEATDEAAAASRGRKGGDSVIRPGARIEAAIQRAVGVQTRQTGARRAVVRREIAPADGFAVGLDQ